MGVSSSVPEMRGNAEMPGATAPKNIVEQRPTFCSIIAMNAESTNGPQAEDLEVPSVETTTITIPELEGITQLLDKKLGAETNEIKKGERCLIWIGIASVVVNFLIGLIYLGQLKEMVKATKASTDAAKAATDSVKVANDTLAASQNAMLLDQRAWVGLTELKIVTEGDHPEQQGFAINSGKTPARNVHAVMGVYARFSPKRPVSRASVIMSGLNIF
jgi:hypothetical protein